MAPNPEACRRFAALHESGCFTMPNAWDAGSARLLASRGFQAIGTTSAGLAFTLGVEDAASEIPLPTVLDNVRAITSAVSIPVSVDFENGYADDPEGVARNVVACAEAGAAGCSIEDWSGDAQSGLYEPTLAAERIAAACEAARGLGTGFVITARSEACLYGGEDAFDDALARCRTFAELGADCVYAPGLRDRALIKRFIDETGAPTNILVGIAGMGASFDEMRALGARRLSTGGSFARTAWATLKAVADEIAGGRFDYTNATISEADLMTAFARKSHTDPYL